MDYRQVFSLLVAFMVVVFILSLSSNFLDSVVNRATTTGQEVFRTQKYMAATVSIYSRGDEFGLYEPDSSRDLCRLDTEVLENHGLGISARLGPAYSYSAVNCHSDTDRYMSSVMLTRVDTDRYSGTEIGTLEVGER